MELLDLVNEVGIPTGQTIERHEAHRVGALHRTSHVWLVRKKEGHIQLLLQQRSACKGSSPGCLDLSSDGQFPAGQDLVSSALRELQEELGVTAAESELYDCGQRTIRYHAQFHGRPFLENQISKVYFLWKDPPSFRLQPEEVEKVLWMDFDACVQGVQTGAFPNCIALEELMMLKRAIAKQQM